MVAAAEPFHESVFAIDDATLGCISCVSPKRLFAEVADDPELARAVLLHVYVSLQQTMQDALASSFPPKPDEGWEGIRTWTNRAVTEKAQARGVAKCSLLTTWCASSREFSAAFVFFADKLLFRAPLDDDPGDAKEMTVKLALALDPPGMLPVIFRFIRSGARISARMKAVRDLCGGVARPEVRQMLEWVVANDVWLRERASHCLEGTQER